MDRPDLEYLSPEEIRARAEKARVERAVVIDPRAPYDTARLFQSRLATALHYHRGAFYEWDGSSWPEAGADGLRSFLYGFLDRCEVRGAKGALTPAKPNALMVGSVLDALRGAAYLDAAVAAPAWLDGAAGPPAHEIIACANGLLHVPTLNLLPHTPSYFNHNALDYAYQPKAPEPRQWLAFLSQIWPDDPESIAALQQGFGYLLTSDTSQQKAVLIVGPKRSGKGTIGRVLARLVGLHNYAAPTLASLGERFGLAPLIGKSLAIISDARLSGRADQQVIVERLLSITGEDGQTIDRKYATQPWTGRLPTRFAILTNELPRLGDASGALASRFILLLMTRSFYGQEDLGLTDRLLTELPSIFKWALDGWADLKRSGHFKQPASARQALEQLEDLSSPIGAFVRERCEIGPLYTAEVSTVFGAWEAWCEGQNREHAGTVQNFARDLRAAVPGLTVAQVGSRGERVRVYQGLNLKGGWNARPATPDF
jgi:putative DNA primase/helicase